jgi:formate hydrogenlyase subunit 3/multisubunit Na+/H+ antiporter MnhD subunit
MSVVSLYYYIRFIRAMYIEGETEPQPVTLAPSLRVALVAAAVLVLYLGVFPQRLISFTQKAGMSPGLKTYSYQDAAKSKTAEPPGMSGEPGPVPPPR